MERPGNPGCLIHAVLPSSLQFAQNPWSSLLGELSWPGCVRKMARLHGVLPVASPGAAGVHHAAPTLH